MRCCSLATGTASSQTCWGGGSLSPDSAHTQGVSTSALSPASCLRTLLHCLLAKSCEVSVTHTHGNVHSPQGKTRTHPTWPKWPLHFLLALSDSQPSQHLPSTESREQSDHTNLAFLHFTQYTPVPTQWHRKSARQNPAVRQRSYNLTRQKSRSRLQSVLALYPSGTETDVSILTRSQALRSSCELDQPTSMRKLTSYRVQHNAAKFPWTSPLGCQYPPLPGVLGVLAALRFYKCPPCSFILRWRSCSAGWFLVCWGCVGSSCRGFSPLCFPYWAQRAPDLVVLLAVGALWVGVLRALVRWVIPCTVATCLLCMELGCNVAVRLAPEVLDHREGRRVHLGQVQDSTVYNALPDCLVSRRCLCDAE
jgi:hypothetical protein